MTRHDDALHIHLGPPSEHGERCRHLVELLAVQQLHLTPVPALLAACFKGSAHQVAVGRALTRRQTKTLAKEKKKTYPRRAKTSPRVAASVGWSGVFEL